MTFALRKTAVLCGIVWRRRRWATLWPVSDRAGRPAPNAVARAPGDQGVYSPWASLAVLLITALDLALGNAWLVATVPGELLRRPSPLAEAVRAAVQDMAPVPPRFQRQAFWTPDRWQKTAAPDRWNEIVAWDHDTLFQNIIPSWPVWHRSSCGAR